MKPKVDINPSNAHDEFCYCEKLGYIESVIMRRECDEWSPDYS